MQRLDRLTAWIHGLFPGRQVRLAPASADASFRRYFRVWLDDKTFIAMDAPPSHEDCQPFLHVARLFLEAGVNVPRILMQDLSQGFLLLTDLGDTTYLTALPRGDAGALYRDALAALTSIQLASRPGELPSYDEGRLMAEMRLFPDWYIDKHLQATLSAGQKESLESTFRLVLANNLNQPRVFVHRDYHSRNLMLSDPNPGILDFQDAVYGPITYDLVSLFKDAYIAWDEEQVLDWIIRHYWEPARRLGLPVAGDFAAFYRDYEWMGVQRHIKVLGIFARLYHRDGKAGYLNDMPLVMRYLRQACERYRELNPVLRLLDAVERQQPAVGYTF
jgi:N-acetylmuramate 1-kinase